MFFVLAVLGLAWGGGMGAINASASVSGKSFSIVYSSDERGAISPCG
jgi:hypothetical protein